MTTTKKTTKKTKKVKAPEKDYEAGYKLRENMISLGVSNISEGWGMEALLYDMGMDFKKARGALGNLVLHGMVETNIGTFEVNLLNACSHRRTRRNNGRVAFKYHMAYKHDGSQEIKTHVHVVSAVDVDDALRKLCYRVGEQINDWYEDKYVELYPEAEGVY